MMANTNFHISITGVAEKEQNPTSIYSEYFGSQWMLLKRDHVVELLRRWMEKAPRIREMHRKLMCKCGNPADNPNEEYLQTILHRDMGVKVVQRTIVEQSEKGGAFWCPCQKLVGEGGKADWHAKLYADTKNGHFKRKLRNAARISDTFLFRKVAAEVSVKFLNDELELGLDLSLP